MQISLLAAVSLAGAALLTAEVVEEETWYNAGGEVVKKVTRTLTGDDARRSADWEPAWVLRERQSPSRTIRYASGSSWWGGGYASPYYYSGRYYTNAPCRWGGYGSTVRRVGLRGFYHHGGGGSRWGVRYRSPGLTLHFRR